MRRQRTGVPVRNPKTTSGLDNSRSQSSTRKANLETVTDTLPLNGYKLFRGKKNLPRRRKRFYESFSSRQKSRKSLALTIRWNLRKSCDDSSWNHRTSTLRRSETNGIAERAVRKIKAGTSAVLLQSGLDETWWADSMECYYNLRNIQDLLADGKTLYERRFGEPFEGPIIPFGAMVEYHPISSRDQSRLHQFRKKVWPGMFIGYALFARGIWEGDMMVADIEEMKNLDASGIHLRKLNGKDITPNNGENIKFRIEDENSKIVWKRPRSPRTHSKADPNREERRSQWRTSRRTGSSSTDRNQR